MATNHDLAAVAALDAAGDGLTTALASLLPLLDAADASLTTAAAARIAAAPAHDPYSVQAAPAVTEPAELQQARKRNAAVLALAPVLREVAAGVRRPLRLVDVSR